METKTKQKTKNEPAFSEHSVRLRAFRKFKGMTQNDVAEEYGVVQSMIYKYEKGINVIPFELPKFYHDKYRMSYEWFYNNIGPMEFVNTKDNLVKNTAQLLGEIEQLKHEITTLKKQMKVIIKEVYDNKS